MWIPWLGETLFYSKGEPREAIVAMAMLQSGDWVLPTTFGCEMPFKPPFLAWLIAAFSLIFNGGVVNEFISRLPSALAGIMLVMSTYKWVREVRGERMAVLTAMILATSVEVFRAAIACRVDMVLTACIVGALYQIFTIDRNLCKGKRGNFKHYAFATALLTCAVLTKGPIGALLPCLAAGIYLLWSGRKFWPTLASMAALCIASFLLPSIWYYMAWRQGGADFFGLVYEENILRLTGKMSYESHVKPFWYNFITIALGMLPWTLLAAMAAMAWRKVKSQTYCLMPAGQFAITVAVVVIGFYCIPASKRSVYLLPAYPFLAYGVAHIADTLRQTRIPLIFSRILATMGIIAPIALMASSWWPIAGYSLDCAWWGYIVLMLPVAISLLWLVESCKHNAMEGAVAICWALFTCYSAVAMPATFNRNSDKPQADELAQMAGQDAAIYAVDVNTYCLNYYLNNKVLSMPTAEGADSLPIGSILIFSNAEDTTALPTGFELKPLTNRLADTRRPAWIAQRVAPTAALDSLETSPCAHAPAAQKSPLSTRTMKMQTLPPDSTGTHRSQQTQPGTSPILQGETTTSISPQSDTHSLLQSGETDQ